MPVSANAEHVGFVQVNFYGHDLEETEVPEPASWKLVALCLAVLAVLPRLRWMRTLMPALLLCVVARADTIFVDLQLDVFIGTAQLKAADGTLLSTKNAITVDMLPSPDMAAQIGIDALVPTYVQDHIGDFIGITNLGALISPIVIPFADAEQSLLDQLTTQSQPFVITGDTGLLAVSAPFALGYISGPFPDGLGNTYEGDLNVSLFERDLEETEVPEPASWKLGAVALACLALVRRRRRWI